MGSDTPEVIALLKTPGARQRGDVGELTQLLEDWEWADSTDKTDDWDFSAARDLLVWCNGPARGQSPRAIRGLLETGYPSRRIKYYRGGMQMWQLWGLTTVVPTQ